MPDSPPSSNDSLEPSATRSAEEEKTAPKQTPFWIHLALFLATVASMFTVRFVEESGAPAYVRLVHAAQFAGTLTAILLAHEFGHYFAARYHKVDASLPFFIPFPFSTFGTMAQSFACAAPSRRETHCWTSARRDRSRACASQSPHICGVPCIRNSFRSSRAVTEWSSAIRSALKVMDHFASGTAPPGMELSLSPVAFAAWAGMLVTMINLFPVSQLDGGHVAYSLLGPRQDRVAVNVHRSMLVFFFVSVAAYSLRDIRGGIGLYRIGTHVQNSLFWLLWFHVLAVIGTATASERAVEDSGVMSIRVRVAGVIGLLGLAWVGTERANTPFFWVGWFAGLALFIAMDVRGGFFKKHSLLDHPATGGEKLNLTRAVIAVITLAWFVLLFMPAPISI